MKRAGRGGIFVQFFHLSVESRRCGEKPFKVVIDVWGLILFSKTYLLVVSAWEVIRSLLPFRGWGRRELGCGTGRQQHRAAGSESHRAISRLRQRGQEGKEAGSYSPQLISLLAMARRLCLKWHRLFVIMLRVTLEMSTVGWQGFKRSSPCLWWSYLLDLKIKHVFPEWRI